MEKERGSLVVIKRLRRVGEQANRRRVGIRTSSIGLQTGGLGETINGGESGKRTKRVGNITAG